MSTTPPGTSPFLPQDAVTVIELLKRTSGDPDLWSAEERRAVMRLAATRPRMTAAPTGPDPRTDAAVEPKAEPARTAVVCDWCGGDHYTFQCRGEKEGT